MKTAVLLALATLTACSTVDMGGAKTTATGAAGGSTSVAANRKLEKCPRALGTLVVDEDTGADWYATLTQEWKLGPTTPVLRLLAQQSNCFVIVDRNRGMRAGINERTLSETGEVRSGSRMGPGQLVAADFALSPTLTFSNQRAGNIVGDLGGSIGRLLGNATTDVGIKEASTMLTLVDTRSGVQLGAAEGSARSLDVGGSLQISGASFSGLGGGYTTTSEGKLIVAALTDAHNNLVRAVRAYKAQEVKGGLGTGGNLPVQGAPKKK